MDYCPNCGICPECQGRGYELENDGTRRGADCWFCDGTGGPKTKDEWGNNV